MAPAENKARELWETLRECNIHPRIVIHRIFGVSPRMFWQYVEGAPMPEDWESACEKLTIILRTNQRNGKLPRTRDELLWYGIVHVCECVGVTHKE